MVFQGSFVTKIRSQETTIRIKIKANYEVVCEFKHGGRSYEFLMNRWKKTERKVMNATSSFNKFGDLFSERYADDKLFGTTTETEEDGKITIVISRTQKQIKNILIYAAMEVFLCAENIIMTQRRAILDYCIFHREKNQDSNYEEYIHLVACLCLVHSNFLASDTIFDLVGFALNPRSLNDLLLAKVDDVTVAAAEEEGKGDEGDE